MFQLCIWSALCHDITNRICTLTHEKTSTNTSVRAAESKLLGDLDQTAGGALSGKTLGLVDLGEHSIGGLGDDGGGEASNETRAKVDGRLGAAGGSALINGAVNGFADLLIDDEFGHGIRDPVNALIELFATIIICDILLEKDGTEAGIESAHALVLQDLAEAADEAISEGGFGNETDTGGFERAEGNVGEELGGGG